MLPYGEAGVTALRGRVAFAPATEPQAGNNRPAWTGSPGNVPDTPAPHPPTQPLGGRIGRFDGASGCDPGSPGGQLPAYPRVVAPVVEGQASNGAAGPPLGYGQGAGRSYGADGWGWAARLDAPNREDPLPHGRPSFWRGGIQGFNDQLQVRDRHAYWDRGSSRNFGSAGRGVQFAGANPQNDGPARADLRTVNRSVNPQIGSDASRNADDLSRPYTWLGQQDGTSVPVYGGVPGLWASYGNRGMADGIHDPSNGQGGLMAVSSGPPHGLHSDTMPAGKQIADRYKATPQMRPVRLDRPDNSRVAGQSYSQTVQMQGQTGAGGASTERSGLGVNISLGAGWRGR